MARNKKNGKFITLYLESEAADSLDSCAKNLGMSKTAIVERAVKQYVRHLDKVQEIVNFDNDSSDSSDSDDNEVK